MRERLRLIAEPAAERLVRQTVAALEQEAAVERERQADDLVERATAARRRRGRSRRAARRGARRPATRFGARRGARRSSRSTSSPPSSSHAPDQRDDARLPLQPVISAGLSSFTAPLRRASDHVGRVLAVPGASALSRSSRRYRRRRRCLCARTRMPPLVVSQLDRRAAAVQLAFDVTARLAR